MPEAISCVVIYHAHCLHESVADGRAHKFEAMLEKPFAHGIRRRGPRRYLGKRSKLVRNRFAFDKLPNVFIKGTPLLLNSQELLGIHDGRLDLETIANDA